MAEQNDSELSDQEENSILIACLDSCESFADADSLEPLHDESEGNTEEKNDEFDGIDWEDFDDDDNFDSPSNNVATAAASTSGTSDTSTQLMKGSILLKFGRPGYVWVSDLSSQSWCEMQTYYNLSWSLQMGLDVLENPFMQMGSTIHLARELSIQDRKEILTESKEDSIGIKFLNLLSAIKVFHSNGRVAREVPICGAPFGKGLFVVGIIDELRFDPVTYTIELVELKTRKNKTLPWRAVKKQHRFQVMLYCKIFDDLVKGLLPKKTIAEKFGVSLKKKFNPILVSHVINAGFYFDDLDHLLDYVLRTVQSLPCINKASIEYMHQDTLMTFGFEKVVYSEVELCLFFRRYADFWLGKRDPDGVDIEEAYKCQTCEHADYCDWRKKKNKEFSERNRTKASSSS